MRKLIIIVLVFLGINLDPMIVTGDHYDITTMYKFNTEETYLDGEVITRYLNTCSVSVHPQTNAIGLPYMNMDTTQPGESYNYPLKSPAVPPLSFPFESSEWKSLTSSGAMEDLQSNSLLQDNHTRSTLFNSYKDKALFTLLEESEVLQKLTDIENDRVLFDRTEINMMENVFLFVQIKKGDLKFRGFLLRLTKDYTYVQLRIKYGTNETISVCSGNINYYGEICNDYSLQQDEYNHASFYINLKGDFILYDAIGYKIHIITSVDSKEYTSISYSSSNYQYNDYSKVTFKIVQSPQFLYDQISIVSPWLHIEKNFTMFLVYVKKDGNLIAYLEEFSWESLEIDEYIQLESQDVIKFSTDTYEAVVAKIKVMFPANSYRRKRIHIKVDKHAYITDIWEGGDSELYPIHDSKICEKSNTKEIYDVVFRNPKASKNVTACINGGIYDGLNRMCSCPPGFTGDSCEIACGRNLFGQTCSKMCSNTEAECMGMILCTPSYGCACAPGYHGEQCSQECEEGTYGADCTQTCGRCKGGCDRYTGVCRECESPYLIWPACKQPHSYWKEYPMVENSTYTSIKLGLDFSLKNIEKSLDKTKYYTIQYKEDSDILWRNCSYNQLKQLRTLYTVQKLNPGRKYLFKVLLVDETFNTNDPEFSKISVGITKCSVSKIDNNLNVTKVTSSSIALTWKKEISIVGNECPFSSYTLDIDDSIRIRKIFNITGNAVVVRTLIPGQPYEFNLRKNTIHGESVPVSSIRVTTETTTDNTMSVAGVVANIMGSDIYLQWFKSPLYETYYIKYKLIRRLSCSQDKIQSPLQVVPTSATNHTLKLEPNAQYEIFVTIDPFQETSVRNFTQTTDSKLPNIAPNLLKHKFRVTNESVQVHWTDPTTGCIQMNGFFRKYAVQLLGLHNTILKTYETQDRKLEITRLNPTTDYKLRIRYTNQVGDSPIYAEHSFTTKATSFIKAEDLTAYKTSANLVGLRWKIPDSNSTITATIVNVQSQADSKTLNITNLTALQCKAWPTYVCYNVPHLKQNTKYTISVDIFSNEFPEGGSQKSIQVVTRETAPSPVNDIKVENISNKNMTISWRIPFLLNGILRKFLIEVEHLSSFDETLCCQSITTITSAVNEEKEIYNYVLENIQNASSYQVTIRAFTKRLGQETSKIIDTAPQLIPIKQIPQIQVGGKVISWQDLKVANSSSEFQLTTDLLIIVESNENDDNSNESSVLKTELGHYLSNNWWLAHVCAVSEDCSLNIGTGEESDSPYGTVRNSPLTVGHKYTVVLAQVNKYLSARSFTIAKSAQFEMDSTSLLTSTTETTIASTLTPSEPFTSTEPTVVEVESTSTGADGIVLPDANTNSQEEMSQDKTLSALSDYDTDRADNTAYPEIPE